jgi:hypothetical protein
MFQNLTKSVLALVVIASASAYADRFSVDDRDLEDLQLTIESIDRDVQDLLRRSGHGGAGGGFGINRELRALSEKISGRRGLMDWVKEVRRRGGHPGGGHGPGPTPRPTLLTVAGLYVVGKADVKDVSEAGRSHSQECQRWETFLRGELGSSFDIFQCGPTFNVSQYSSISYTQLASKPQFTVMVPAGITPRSASTADIAGTTDGKDAGASYDSWATACMQVLKAEKAKYGARFIAASCGEPKNVSKYTSIGYIQYYSTGTVYLQ